LQSAAAHAGTSDGLAAKLRVLERLPVEGMDAWLAEYRLRGCPPVHHSDAFRGAYNPHYRILTEPLASRFHALLSACLMVPQEH
jgi:hypothetical protein